MTSSHSVDSHDYDGPGRAHSDHDLVNINNISDDCISENESEQLNDSRDLSNHHAFEPSLQNNQEEGISTNQPSNGNIADTLAERA